MSICEKQFSLALFVKKIIVDFYINQRVISLVSLPILIFVLRKAGTPLRRTKIKIQEGIEEITR